MPDWGVINRQGKDYALYPRLLAEAHAQGLKRVTSTLLQAPSAENDHLAIVWAEVETDRGSFSGLGDASPENVGRVIAPHLVRMAETRAKARALRDALNIQVLLEGEAEAGVAPESRQAAPTTSTPAQPTQPVTYQYLVDAASRIYDDTGGIMMDLPESDDPAVLARHLVWLREEYRKFLDTFTVPSEAQMLQVVALRAETARKADKAKPLSAYGAQTLINQLTAEVAARLREEVPL